MPRKHSLSNLTEKSLSPEEPPNTARLPISRDSGSQDTTPTPTPTPSPTPTPAPLRLILAESPVVPNQVAALTSLLFLTDPFQVFDQSKLLKLPIDPNTRVTVFVQNLQLLPGEDPSTVVVRLVDSLQTYEIPAEGVRLVEKTDFSQVTFRLPDDLSVDDWTILIKAHGQVTNSGVMRIR